MTSSPNQHTTMLVVNGEHAVGALLRAIVSAKFSPDPRDRDVPASPLVAGIARDATALLEQAEVEREGDAARERWRAWRDFHPGRQEWRAAMSFAVEAFAGRWAGWSVEQREAALGDLVAPYELSAASLEEFVRELEAALE